MGRLMVRCETFVVVALMSLREPRLTREEGQTFVEYALILSLISVACIGALTFLHDKIAGFYTEISNEFGAAIP